MSEDRTAGRDKFKFPKSFIEVLEIIFYNKATSVKFLH